MAVNAECLERKADEVVASCSGPALAFFIHDAVTSSRSHSEGLIFGTRRVHLVRRTTDAAQHEERLTEDLSLQHLVKTGSRHSFYGRDYGVRAADLDEWTARCCGASSSLLGWFIFRRVGADGGHDARSLERRVSSSLRALAGRFGAHSALPLLLYVTQSEGDDENRLCYQLCSIGADGQLDKLKLLVVNVGDTNDEQRYWRSSAAPAVDSQPVVPPEWPERMVHEAKALAERAIAQLQQSIDRLDSGSEAPIAASTPRVVPAADSAAASDALVDLERELSSLAPGPALDQTAAEEPQVNTRRLRSRRGAGRGDSQKAATLPPTDAAAPAKRPSTLPPSVTTEARKASGSDVSLPPAVEANCEPTAGAPDPHIPSTRTSNSIRSNGDMDTAEDGFTEAAKSGGYNWDAPEQRQAEEARARGVKRTERPSSSSSSNGCSSTNGADQQARKAARPRGGGARVSSSETAQQTTTQHSSGAGRGMLGSRHAQKARGGMGRGFLPNNHFD